MCLRSLLCPVYFLSFLCNARFIRKYLLNLYFCEVSCSEIYSHLNVKHLFIQEGGVFTFGAGGYGQLGHNSTSHEINPRKVFELMGSVVTQITCGR